MTTSIPVRWRDRDALGHVNAAVFPTYFEESRNAWLVDHLGASFGPEEYVIARMEIDYRAEVAPGVTEVLGEHRVERVGNSSVTLAERLLDAEGSVLAEARFVIVFWVPAGRRSRPLKDPERRALVLAQEASGLERVEDSG
jgi:acyl-CoA thioester hydrolase